MMGLTRDEEIDNKQTNKTSVVDPATRRRRGRRLLVSFLSRHALHKRTKKEEKSVLSA
jgi:hypothetical protein